MLPFAILGFVMKPLQLKGFVPADSKKVLALESVALGGTNFFRLIWPGLKHILDLK